jgi:hypothetical protein
MAVRQSGRAAIQSGSGPRCKMTREEARLLPVVEWNGREFQVDVDAKRFRNVNDASDFIDMHSRQGRAIMRQMQGVDWHVFAVDSGGQRDVTV